MPSFRPPLSCLAAVETRMGRFTAMPRLILAFVTVIAAGACVPSDDGAGTETPSRSAAEPADATAQPLEGRTWTLATLDGAPVSVPTERARPTLSFDADSKSASGMAAVNRFSGPYVKDAGSLKLGPLIATKMAGPPELNELETRFLRALEQTTAWRMEGGELELLSGEQVVARFTAAAQ